MVSVLGSECPDTSWQIVDIAKTSPSPDIFHSTKRACNLYIYFEQIRQLMYGVQNNLVPENILNMFQKVTYTHKYRTQSNAS